MRFSSNSSSLRVLKADCLQAKACLSLAMCSFAPCPGFLQLNVNTLVLCIGLKRCILHRSRIILHSSVAEDDSELCEPMQKSFGKSTGWRNESARCCVCVFREDACRMCRVRETFQNQDFLLDDNRYYLFTPT